MLTIKLWRRNFFYNFHFHNWCSVMLYLQEMFISEVTNFIYSHVFIPVIVQSKVNVTFDFWEFEHWLLEIYNFIIDEPRYSHDYTFYHFLSILQLKLYHWSNSILYQTCNKCVYVFFFSQKVIMYKLHAQLSKFFMNYSEILFFVNFDYLQVFYQ